MKRKRNTRASDRRRRVALFSSEIHRNTVIVFDFKEALSFEGETGFYCQYSAVRTNSIFRKLEENGLENATKPFRPERPKNFRGFSRLKANEIWSITFASRLEETIAQAATATEPAILAKYKFNLAKAFNLFYHNHKILRKKTRQTRRSDRHGRYNPPPVDRGFEYSGHRSAGKNVNICSELASA